MHSTSAVDTESECFADEDVFVSSEEVVSAASRLVQLKETSGTLKNFSSRTPQHTLQHYIKIAEGHWSCVRAEISENAEIASAVCDQLAR